MKKIGVIGTGNICGAHISSYKTFPNECKIVALCDIYPEKAEKKKQEFDLEAEIFDDHLKMLDKDLDLVSICTPPYTHKEIAINCMEAGFNVIIEKPMAQSIEECDEIIAVTKKTGKTVSSIAQNRFSSEILKIKAILDKGFIGEILSTTVNSYWWRGHCYYDLWWRGTWAQEGGGCTLNHAVHHIDMLNWLMGKTPKKITSVLANLAHDNAEIEDLSISIFEYEKAVGSLTGSTIHHGERKYLEFQGTKAMITYPFDVCASESRSNGFPEPNETLEKEIIDFYKSLENITHEGHIGQIKDVMDAIDEKREPFITVEDGKNTVEVITGIYKSGTEHMPITLPFKKDDTWYTQESKMENAHHFYKKTNSEINLGDDNISL